MHSKLLSSISLALPLLLAAPVVAQAQEAAQSHGGHGHAHGDGEQEAGEDIRALLPNANKRMLFALADSNGDGALSLEEAQAVMERVFSAIDENGDGQVTPEEIESFYGDIKRRAQEPRIQNHSDHAQHGEGFAASQAYMDAMDAMMEEMDDMEMTGDPSIDFVVMMIPHHQSAVDMAEVFLEQGNDPELAKLAQEIIDAQEGEIEMMEDWLRERGR